MSKRLFDWLASGLGLLVLGPLLLLLAIWIKLDSPGPIFFKQDRVGLGGRTFRIHKFRTMVTDAEKKGCRSQWVRTHVSREQGTGCANTS